MDSLLNSALAPVLQYGVLGAITVIFAVVIGLLWKNSNAERDKLLSQITALQNERVSETRSLHQQRVADAQLVQETLLDANRQSTTALNAATAAIEAMRETMLETKQTLKELGDDMRQRRAR